MSQTGPRPSSGARYALEHCPEETGAVVYRGFVHLPDADVPVEVRFGEGGAAQARVEAAAIPAGGPAPAELERAAAALVKTAVKASASADRPPPRKVVRWRG